MAFNIFFVYPFTPAQMTFSRDHHRLGSTTENLYNPAYFFNIFMLMQHIKRRLCSITIKNRFKITGKFVIKFRSLFKKTQPPPEATAMPTCHPPRSTSQLLLRWEMPTGAGGAPAPTQRPPGEVGLKEQLPSPGCDPQQGDVSPGAGQPVLPSSCGHATAVAETPQQLLLLSADGTFIAGGYRWPLS